MIIEGFKRNNFDIDGPIKNEEETIEEQRIIYMHSEVIKSVFDHLGNNNDSIVSFLRLIRR